MKPNSLPATKNSKHLKSKLLFEKKDTNVVSLVSRKTRKIDFKGENRQTHQTYQMGDFQNTQETPKTMKDDSPNNLVTLELSETCLLFYLCNL